MYNKISLKYFVKPKHLLLQGMLHVKLRNKSPKEIVPKTKKAVELKRPWS